MRTVLSQRFNIVAAAFFLSFVLIAQLQDVQGSLREKNQSLTPYDQERISFVLGKYISIGNNRLNYPPSGLEAVATKDENIGGSDSKQGATRSMRQYRVQPGDSLTGIARRFGLYAASISLVNPDLQDTELLLIGQTLNIPDSDASQEELAKEQSDRQKKALALQQSSSKQLPTTVANKPVSSSTDSRFLLPVQYTYESQRFSRSHPGIDMVAPLGTPITATKSGCITTIGTGWSGGYGNYVLIDHGGGISSRYAHLLGFAGSYVGKCVAAGQIIGYLGSTGRSTGPHLHFELLYNGVQFDPQM